MYARENDDNPGRPLSVILGREAVSSKQIAQCFSRCVISDVAILLLIVIDQQLSLFKVKQLALFSNCTFSLDLEYNYNKIARAYIFLYLITM